jgi:hypothetical protein
MLHSAFLTLLLHPREPDPPGGTSVGHIHTLADGSSPILAARLRATRWQRLRILLASLPQSRRNDGW